MLKFYFASIFSVRSTHIYEKRAASGSGAGSLPITNRSGSGSGPQHCFQQTSYPIHFLIPNKTEWKFLPCSFRWRLWLSWWSCAARCTRTWTTSASPCSMATSPGPGIFNRITYLILVDWFSMAQAAPLRECPSLVVPSNRVISSPFSHKTFFFTKLCEGTPYFFLVENSEKNALDVSMVIFALGYHVNHSFFILLQVTKLPSLCRACMHSFFHRLSILERATDHKCIKECSYLLKKCG